jgi:transposase
LEKRHSLFKSILEISPVFLKRNDRIEALVFIHFVAHFIASLVERQLRSSMIEKKIESLPL